MAGFTSRFTLLSKVLRPLPRFFSSDTNPVIEKSINQVTLLGRVGIKPDLKGTAEHPVTIFTLATNTTYKDQSGEFKQKTEWHRIAVFKPHLRENVFNYLQKGQRCLIQGKISYGQITTAEGLTQITSSIIADDVVFLSKHSTVAETAKERSFLEK